MDDLVRHLKARGVAKIKPVEIEIEGQSISVIAMSAQFCGDGS